MDNTIAAAIYMLAFLPACLFGIWMRRSQRIELLSGVDAAWVTDRARLARFVGNIFMAIGATGLATGVAVASMPTELVATTVIAHVVIVNLLVVLLIAGVRRRSGRHA